MLGALAPAPPRTFGAARFATMRPRPSALLAQLSALGIRYRCFTHQPVFSTSDVASLPERLPGIDTKNLFLRDQKHERFILVCVRAETRVDLKKLGQVLGVRGITFASEEEMGELIGVSPGSVCLFALANDSTGRVTGYLDDSLPVDAEMQNHPLDNTATVVLQTGDLERFCEEANHPLTRITIPHRPTQIPGEPT